jgi:hypothetical protein
MSRLLVAVRYNDPRLFGRLVRLARGGDGSHTEVAVPQGDGLYWCVSSAQTDGGVRPKTMPLPAGKWRLYQTDVPTERAHDYLRKRGHEGYGWWRLVRFLLPMLRPSWGGPICTQATAEIVGLPDHDSWDVRQLEAAIAWRWPRVQ